MQYFGYYGSEYHTTGRYSRLLQAAKKVCTLGTRKEERERGIWICPVLLHFLLMVATQSLILPPKM